MQDPYVSQRQAKLYSSIRMIAQTGSVIIDMSVVTATPCDMRSEFLCSICAMATVMTAVGNAAA